MKEVFCLNNSFAYRFRATFGRYSRDTLYSYLYTIPLVMPPFKMLHQEFEPPEELRDSIKCFWYGNFGGLQANFEVVPDGYAEIIFYFGDSCGISYKGDLQQLSSPFIMGLLNQPAIVSPKDRLEIIGIRCFPWAVFNLLGLASPKEGMQLFDHTIARLQYDLQQSVDSGRIEEAVNLVKHYLLNAQSGIVTDSILFKAGNTMRNTNGTIPVSAIADAANATVRTLERKFRQSSGHTIKDISGLMRFEQVRNRLWLEPGTNLAGLATELGYTDQSHLSREFKRYSGTTPGAFARKAKE